MAIRDWFYNSCSSHSCSAPTFLCIIIMLPSKTPVSSFSLARTSLTKSNVFVLTTRRAYSHFPPTRRRPCLLQPSRLSCLLVGRRTLSTSPWRRFADFDDLCDPREREHERESDEVHVCIVGGGISCGSPPLKHANALQDPPASAQPFVSNRSPTKPETKTSEFFFSRKQASWALTSSPAMSSNRPPSTNCSPTGMIQITHHVSNMLPRLLMISCDFLPKTALYRSPRLRK